MTQQINREFVMICWMQWELTSWNSFLTYHLENVFGTLGLPRFRHTHPVPELTDGYFKDDLGC